MKYDIFISYRRKGGYETAKHLYDLFSKDGYRVSFDLDTLRNGDFDQALLKRIDQCSDFILILSKGAFARTLDPAFNPRQDWLRIELAYALKKQKNIIPILLEGFEGFPENLPADIKDVAKKNGPQYNQYYFDEFYKKLKTDFLETRKSRFFSLKTILILSALILCAGGIWWYLQEVSGKQCILSKNNTINKSDTLKTESPDSPATPLTSGKEKKDPATPEQNKKIAGCTAGYKCKITGLDVRPDTKIHRNRSCKPACPGSKRICCSNRRLSMGDSTRQTHLGT